MAEIEKIANDRYRLRAHGQIMTLSAEGLLDVYHYVIQHSDTLTREVLGDASEEAPPGDDRESIEQHIQELNQAQEREE
jgi:hypothetical protein